MSELMSLEMADAIRMDWGKFLELTSGTLILLFMARIPESLLPYPREEIEEALNIVANNFKHSGDNDGVRIVEESKSFLLFFIDDEEALEAMKTNLNNNDIVKVILPKLGTKQKDQLKYQQSKY